LAQPPLRSVSRPSKTVVRVEVDASAKGFEWWVLLSSDRHHDNAYCNQKAEKAHLDLAKERGAGIIDIGDLFCCLQGKYDPRSDRSQLRAEHNQNSYLDALVDEAADFYAPYCENWLFMSPGNHESSVSDRCGTNLTDRLADGMRIRSGAPRSPMVGTYQGWVALQFKWGVRNSQTFKIRYTHGYGGGGPVTKDMIQSSRQLAYTENADFLLSGHTHDAWYCVQPRTYLDDYGNEKTRNVTMLKLGTYKSEFEAGNGWAVGKGHPPRPIGAWWCQFYQVGDEIRYRVQRTDDV
jgi:hypothetical protein